MRLSLAALILAALALAAPAHADWTCWVEKPNPDRSGAGAGAYITLDDAGMVKHEEIRWTPARVSGGGGSPLLIYDFTGKPLSEGVLTNIRIANMAVGRGADAPKAFVAIQVDAQPATIHEWTAFANRGEPPPPPKGSIGPATFNGVVDFFRLSDGALFDQVTAPGARVLKVHLISSEGETMTSGQYNLAAPMAADRLVTQALNDARNKVRGYRRNCQQAG